MHVPIFQLELTFVVQGELRWPILLLLPLIFVDHVAFFELLPGWGCLQLYVDLLDRALAVHLKQGRLRVTLMLLIL